MKSLTPSDLRFLAHCDGRARAVAEISKLMKIPTHIGYRMEEKLSTLGIVSDVVADIDLARLGYRQYSVFISIGAKNERPLKAILSKLENSNDVTWLFLTSGVHQIGFSLMSKTADEADARLKQLLSPFEATIVQSSYSEQMSFARYGNRFLPNTRASFPASTDHRAGRSIADFDDLDRQILNTMSSDDSTNTNEIARKLGVPLSTVARRIKQLEAQKVIVGYRRRISLERCGYSIFVILLKVRIVSTSADSRMATFARKVIPATFLVRLFGAWQYELGVVLQSPEQVTEVIQELYCDLGDIIASVEIVPVLRYLKQKSSGALIE